MSSPLQSLLPPDLVLVELGEVVDDDGDGQGNDEDAANTAEDADALADRGLGHNVAVAHSGHGDGRPPEGVRDALELIPVPLALCKEGETGEDEDAHGEEEHEEAELLVAVLEGEGDGLEPGGVSRQLKDSHDTHNSEHLDDSSNIVERCPAFFFLWQLCGPYCAGSGPCVEILQGQNIIFLSGDNLMFERGSGTLKV